MTTLTQRIDNILGPWPTPDSVREAFLLLARHLQRHDELVTLQRDIDAYAADRRMPDDALDALEAHRDRLRQEIWDGTPILHLAKEAEADEEYVTLDPAHKGRVARTPDGKPWTPAERYDEMVARYMAVQAEVAEHRRHVATVMQREEALKKRVEELERERDADAEPLEECGEDEVIEQEEAPHAHLHFDVRTGTVEATMSDRPGMLFVPKEHLVAAEQHVAELEARLAERDADSEVGRAIRGWKPKAGHIRAWIEQIRMIADGTPRYRMMWRKAPGREGHTCWYCSIADAIREYNERED